MRSTAKIVIALFSLVSVASCDSPTKPADATDPFIGRWVKGTSDLPPVEVEVRREANGVVGQVWLSGTTYTWPAYVHDSELVITNPVSSALAPFSGVLLTAGSMRATLRGNPNVEVTLYKVIKID